MNVIFARTLSRLRREKGVSQRQAAQALGVSQALLSHYENGIREPGLAFVVKACDYYEVSADYLLGRQEGRRAEPLPPTDQAALLAAADLLADLGAGLCRRRPEGEALFRRLTLGLEQRLARAGEDDTQGRKAKEEEEL